MESTFLTKTTFLTPSHILTDLGLGEGDTVIDYGCGAGHWVFAAAKLVGPKGTVYAVENDEGLLEMVKGRAEMAGFTNVESILTDLEKDELDKVGEADLVIVANVLSSIADKKAFVQRVEKLVSDNGKLIFVDWHPGENLFGPRKENRLNEEAVLSLFEKSGLHFACTVETGHHHYGLVFDRKGEGCGWKRSE
jgi:ubiquinone/menaquinone biosynthesis C-methylase UbiE